MLHASPESHMRHTELRHDAARDAHKRATRMKCQRSGLFETPLMTEELWAPTPTAQVQPAGTGALL